MLYNPSISSCWDGCAVLTGWCLWSEVAKVFTPDASGSDGFVTSTEETFSVSCAIVVAESSAILSDWPDSR